MGVFRIEDPNGAIWIGVPPIYQSQTTTSERPDPKKLMRISKARDCTPGQSRALQEAIAVPACGAWTLRVLSKGALAATNLFSTHGLASNPHQLHSAEAGCVQSIQGCCLLASRGVINQS